MDRTGMQAKSSFDLSFFVAASHTQEHSFKRVEGAVLHARRRLVLVLAKVLDHRMPQVEDRAHFVSRFLMSTREHFISRLAIPPFTFPKTLFDLLPNALDVLQLLKMEAPK